MPFRQQVVAFAISAGLLLLIVELIRRRKLREEYSVLWFLTGLGILVLVAWYDLLVWMTSFIGAVLPTSTLFFFALVFLFLVCLQYSVRISSLDNNVKELAQQFALSHVKAPAERETLSGTSREDD
ncbi:MAG: DUF2304 domain-containing protein [Acidobacteria bacterium]|nr:MAG: DUF2304 domain-containing protein [Acidobacteriota bacterium]